jgi:phosphoglycerol transferase MdoB-like AlkP superfamily enzyme
MDLQGWEAVVLAVAYIAFGAFLHFQFFWGRHPRLRPWSPRLKKAALLVGACGIGYALLRRIF